MAALGETLTEHKSQALIETVAGRNQLLNLGAAGIGPQVIKSRECHVH